MSFIYLLPFYFIFYFFIFHVGGGRIGVIVLLLNINMLSLFTLKVRFIALVNTDNPWLLTSTI